MKYGALSSSAGHVEIGWELLSDGGATLILHWREHGGPPVTPPNRKGFGSRLIERSLAAELGSEVNLSFETPGVRCTLRAQLSDEVDFAWPLDADAQIRMKS